MEEPQGGMIEVWPVKFVWEELPDGSFRVDAYYCYGAGYGYKHVETNRAADGDDLREFIYIRCGVNIDLTQDRE